MFQFVFLSKKKKQDPVFSVCLYIDEFSHVGIFSWSLQLHEDFGGGIDSVNFSWHLYGFKIFILFDLVRIDFSVVAIHFFFHFFVWPLV